MAVLDFWIWVLVGCIFAPVAEGSDISDLYPPLWEESPRDLSDYSLKDGKHIINPWVYTDRMGLYRILLTQTATYFEKYGPENEQNVLWELPTEFGWQYKTGRLSDPTRRTNCGYEHGEPLCVSVDSWWADVNYFLSVVPFLAAVETGILGITSEQIKILPPPLDELKFCYNISDCQELVDEAMDKWAAFFKYMQLPSSDFEDLLKHLWAAYTSSLEYPVRIFTDRYAHYSNQEASFEENWAINVLYTAAANFPTTQRRSHGYQERLPPRILVATDRAPLINDFTLLQNTALLSLTNIGNIHRYTGSLSLNTWEYYMSSPHEEEKFLKTLEKILGKKKLLKQNFNDK